MKPTFVTWAALIAVASIVIAGCGQAASPPAPTKAPAPQVAAPTTAAAAPTVAPAPTKATEPTKVAAAPAKKDTYPEKGKTITVIVPAAAGGGADTVARLYAAFAERDLGVAVQVVNRPGGGTIVGSTEIAQSKPDGYTYGLASMQTTILTYLDVERKAGYTRSSFVPVARGAADAQALAVRADSPYKSMKDLIDAAKAKPDTIKVAAGGILSTLQLPVLMIQKETGAQFAMVHFDGGAPGLTALLGGHVDASSNSMAEVAPQLRAGQLRVLGIADPEGKDLLPGVTTMKSQGYNVSFVSSIVFYAPAGTPKDAIDVFSGSLKKAASSDEVKTKLDGVGLKPGFLDPAQLAAFWEQSEADMRPMIELARKP